MKKNLKAILIFMLVLSIQLFLLVYLNYHYVQVKQMYVSNGLYSTWNAILIEEDISQIINHFPSNNRLFIEHNEGGTIRTFYQTDDWIPPLISGEFFHPQSVEREAVVGQRIKEGLEGNTLMIGEDSYRIVGILGTHFPSTLDHIILLNEIPSELPIKRIVVDANHPRQMGTLTQIFDILNLNENHSISRLLNSDFFTQLISLNVYLITILLIIITGYLYAVLYKEENRISYLLGDPTGMILSHSIVHLALIFFGSFIVVLAIDRLTDNRVLFENLPIYVMSLIGMKLIYFISFYAQNKKGETSE